MRVNGGLFDVFFNKKPAGQLGQLGVIVSKQVVRLAVNRNKIRRRVRAIVKPLIVDFIKAYHIKIVVKSQAAGRKFEEMKADLTTLLNKTK